MDHDNPNLHKRSENDVEGAPAAKRVRQKTFSQSWLNLPEFAGWLQQVQDNHYKAFCSCCKKELNCGKSELVKHGKRDSHIKNYRDEYPSNKEPALSRETIAHIADVKIAEIKLAAFFAEHNVAVTNVDHLVPLIKDIFKDSRIAQDMTLCRTKCTKLITNCLAVREEQKLVEILKVQKFSVLVDESTDIADKKSLCVLVQFVCPESKIVKTELLQLIKLNAKDCAAEKLYAAFKSCLELKGIPITNVVGMASDNASVMMGVHNSFMTRLKNDSPRLVVMNCICHSSALIASKACAQLPRSCEEIIRGIGTYTTGSGKRCEKLNEMQELLDYEKCKMLKLADTRWLSRCNCVDRIIENWDPLTFFFANAVTEDNLLSAEKLLSLLEDKSVKAYLLFLKYALLCFNKFNALFQSKTVLIHEIVVRSRLFISEFGVNFLQPKHLEDLASGSLNVKDPNNFLPLDNIMLGPECDRFLVELPEDDVEEIRKSCLQFYVTACSEAQKRLPLKHPLLDDLRFLDPEVALNYEKRGSLRDLSSIAERLGEFNLTKLAHEWTSLPFAFTPDRKKTLLALNVDVFWKEIANQKDLLNEQQFGTLESLVHIVLSLPHSNAEAERIFSIVTDVKTKKRNTLSHDFLNAMCLIRSSFRNDNVDCTTLNVDAHYLELHNSADLYKPSQPAV